MHQSTIKAHELPKRRGTVRTKRNATFQEIIKATLERAQKAEKCRISSLRSSAPCSTEYPRLTPEGEISVKTSHKPMFRHIYFQFSTLPPTCCCGSPHCCWYHDTTCAFSNNSKAPTSFKWMRSLLGQFYFTNGKER